MFHRTQQTPEKKTEQTPTAPAAQHTGALRSQNAGAPAAEPTQSPAATTVKSTPANVKPTQPETVGREKEATMSNETNETPGIRPVDIPGNSPYQRPMSGPAQYGYAGMQSGGAHSHGHNPAHSINSGRRLMIGEGITLSGEIESCDHLIVEGTVEAALKGAKVLDISENGVYYGTVEIENATIAGRFEGDIKVDGRLTVKSTGVIVGTISYRELAVESGATLDGKIAPLNTTAAKDSKPTAGAADFSKSRAAAKQAVEADKADEQLPFGEKAAASA